MWNVDDMKRWLGRLPLLLMAMLLFACEVEDTVTLGPLEIGEVTGETIRCRFGVDGDTPIDYGFYYGTSMDEVEDGTADKVKGSYGLQGIDGVIDGLEPNTVYSVKGYVMTIRGRVCTEIVSVRTTSRAPQADDNEYPDIVFSGN